MDIGKQSPRAGVLSNTEQPGNELSDTLRGMAYAYMTEDYIIVSDLFVEDYVGGAELTLDAILDKCPGPYSKIHSSSLTAELVAKNKTKYWIIGNFAQANASALTEFIRSNVRYTIIECDYKYCKYRSSHLHALQEGKPCDCQYQNNGRLIRRLYSCAQKVFFMSVAQMNEYIRLFPKHDNANFFVLTSVFSDKSLEQLGALRRHKELYQLSPIPQLFGWRRDKWVILAGGSWIKAQSETINYARKHALDFELIGALPPKQFIIELSKYKGLVFRPAGYDTCPRLVIEAKLLGMELKLNANVQHVSEPWFNSDIEACEAYLKGRSRVFWGLISS